MFPLILSLFLTATLGDEANGKNDVRVLIDTIESLQQPIQDFQCEYEGTIRYTGNAAKGQKLGDDGLYDTFSGVFTWKRGGDTRSDSLHRLAPDDRIWRDILVVRTKENQAEQYRRLNDAPLGYAVIKKPKETNSWDAGCLGWILLLDRIKRQFADEEKELSVRDDQIDGRPLKVLGVALKFKNIPSALIFRYWIDLRRNGHVVRQEGYATGEVMGSRLDIELAPFNVGNAEVWMPVRGETVGYADLDKENNPIIGKKITNRSTIYVVHGTMEFNKRPGREVFTIKYKPGTPISDHLRKLTTEFGQQKIDPRPSKVEAQRMLTEQLAMAEEQKAELVVASSAGRFDWLSWIAWGFGGLVLISLLAVSIQRRRR